jgi:hypothetical protein
MYLVRTWRVTSYLWEKGDEIRCFDGSDFRTYRKERSPLQVAGYAQHLLTLFRIRWICN